MKPIYVLSDKQIQGVHNLPIIQTKIVNNTTNLQAYDALILTSKNAVTAIESIDPTWKEIPSYAIASSTAKVIQEYNGNLVYTGFNGHGDQFAKELVPQLKNKKALYIKGVKTVSNLVQTLQDNEIQCDTLTVYETTCVQYSKEHQPQKNATIIFSSPSTIECFFENFDWDESYTAICIGNTTARFLPKNIQAHIPTTTSLEACIVLAKSLDPLA